jgi:pyruvate dehydrogenase E2 component (dihydrolipoamide acetyltransferase)
MTAVASAAQVPLLLPALSEGMEEGTLLQWLIANGEPVSAGDPVAEVETDKATTELEAPAHGRLWHRVAEGETVPVGSELAVVGGDDESPDPAMAKPRPREDRIVATPLARRIARDRGIDLSTLRGSGPRGRIVRADVDAASPAPPAPADLATVPGDDERVTASKVQLRIAQRMALAKSTIPDFAVSMSVDMGPADELRRSLVDHSSQNDVRPPSLNDMIVKASGLALREHPYTNGSYLDGEFLIHEHVNVGVAVATEGSLVVPTVFDADQRSLVSISAEVRRLASAVREGRVDAADLSGGTFTVSNLGMFGVSDFIAVVNPPQAAILAVGSVEEVPVVRDGELAIGKRMSMTLTCDHRILYGADAAAFLGRVRDLLERPISLLI